MRLGLYGIALLFTFQHHCVSAANPRYIQPASITSIASLPSICSPTPTTPAFHFLLPEDELRKRQVASDESTCGFANGIASEARTANSGFDCRVDTANALWGFCPTTVISATDCGLAAACIDSYSCSGICGSPTNTGLTTFTCATSTFCSTVLLENGPDETFSYIACGGHAATDVLLAQVIATTAESTTSSSTKAAATVDSAAPTITPSKTSSSSPSTSTSSSAISTPSLSSTVSSSSSELSASTLKSSSESASFTSSITPDSKATSSAITSSSTPASTSTSAKNTSPIQPPSLLGPILGGTFGGLALIILIILGCLYTLKYRKEHPSLLPKIPQKRSNLWKRRTLPDVQTTGLHELYVEDKDKPPSPAELGGRKAKNRPIGHLAELNGKSTKARSIAQLAELSGKSAKTRSFGHPVELPG